jgi:ankyrin repeat protein
MLNSHDFRFLWVALEIEEICAQVCGADIRKALKSLPSSLTEIIERTIQRIIQAGKLHVCESAFMWVIGAKRPLRLDELQEAMALKLGQQFTDPERVITAIDRLPAWSENLLELDENSNTVHFIHTTIRQYITDAGPETRTKTVGIQEKFAHDRIGELCVMFLDFNDFKTSLMRPTMSPLPALSNTRALANVALRNRMSAKLASGLTQVMSKAPKAISAMDPLLFAVESFKQADHAAERLQQQHPFLRYASVHWLHHTCSRTLLNVNLKIWELCVSGKHPLARTPWPALPLSKPESIPMAGGEIDQAMEWAIANQHYNLAEHLVHFFVPFNYNTDTPSSVSWCFAKLARLEATALIQELVADQGSFGNIRMQAFVSAYLPIPTKPIEGEYQVEREMLSTIFHIARDLQPVDFDIIRQIVFTTTIKACNCPAIRFMLSSHPLLSSQRLAGPQKTPLQLACEIMGQSGYSDFYARQVVTLLLKHGASPEESWELRNADGFELPLLWAIRQNHYNVADLLFEHGADLFRTDSKSDGHITDAMSRLSSRCDFKVTRLLVRLGVTPPTRDKGKSFLHLISAYAKKAPKQAIELLETLKDSSWCDSQSVDSLGRTCLHRAAENCATSGLIGPLVQLGVYLDAKDQQGNTALHISATRRDVDFATELIVQGASTTIKNAHCQTAAEQVLAQKRAHNPSVYWGAPRLEEISELIRVLLTGHPPITLHISGPDGNWRNVLSADQEVSIIKDRLQRYYRE